MERKVFVQLFFPDFSDDELTVLVPVELNLGIVDFSVYDSAFEIVSLDRIPDSEHVGTRVQISGSFFPVQKGFGVRFFFHYCSSIYGWAPDRSESFLLPVADESSIINCQFWFNNPNPLKVMSLRN